MAIVAYAQLATQMHNLTAQAQAMLVTSNPMTTYTKTGNKRGRPSAMEIVARNNHTID